jgi:SAM-dependent methyltransferase
MGAAASAYTLEDQRRMAVATNYFAWQARLVLPELGRRVIEVGCGIGNFTGMLLDREAVMAVDIEAECIEALRARFPGHDNLHTAVLDAGAGDSQELAGFRGDSCVCLNVLEHIEDDAGALRAIASTLTPGGVIVLIVPAFPVLYGPIDENLGHYRRYSRGSIAQLARDAGLRIRKMRYVNCIGFLGWFVNARVWKRQEQSAAQIGMFDRFVVPVQSRVEGMVAPPFGQSLLVVLGN